MSAVYLDTVWRPELLAPAGREDVLHAVLAAGADAVYLSGKQYNMRRHRRDFHFDDSALERAVVHTHGLGRRIYVTVNILLGQSELPALRDYLALLDGLEVDGIIVQDLGVLRICRELGFRPELHASTMLNVSCAEGAAALRHLGVTRVVTSRDITLADARRIAEQGGVEVEYFIHGDMCSVLSGQCLTSGLIFGKSSNRGQCMKPCRWAYDLVSETSGRVIKEGAYLLASRDMCLLQQVPELVRYHIDSLKIEGRMRPAETLVPIVSAYRKAIDRAVEEPLKPARDSAETLERYRTRTRNLTTGFAFRCPDDDFMDMSGEREPIIFSTHGHLRTSDTGFPADSARPQLPSPDSLPIPKLTVLAGTPETAGAALEAGCDRLVLSWEGDLSPSGGWSLAEIAELHRRTEADGRTLWITTPRIIDEAAVLSLRHFAESGVPVDGYVLTDLAALEVLPRENREFWADPALNIMNAEAAMLVLEQGLTGIMPAPEASLKSLAEMIAETPQCAYDLLVHGPLTGMLLEHCLIAMNTQHLSKKDFCQMPCALDRFDLVDRYGNRRRVCTDRYCRNHILLEHDLAMLPVLEQILALGPAAIRIDARVYDAAATARLIGFYRDFLLEPDRRDALRAEFATVFPPEKHTFGAYPLGVCRDEEISRLEIKREEQNER